MCELRGALITLTSAASGGEISDNSGSKGGKDRGLGRAEDLIRTGADSGTMKEDTGMMKTQEGEKQ